MLIISQVKSDAEIMAVQGLIREFTTWAFTLQDDSEQAPTFENLEEELANLPGIYAPPSGRLLLAMQDEQPVGCVALKGHDAFTCELKRMYVLPTYRDQGIGWELVRTLVENARQAGYKRMVLDTHISMNKARELYQAAGFQKVKTPDDFPEALKPYVVFMEYELIDNS